MSAVRAAWPSPPHSQDRAEYYEASVLLPARNRGGADRRHFFSPRRLQASRPLSNPPRRARALRPGHRGDVCRVLDAGRAALVIDEPPHAAVVLPRLACPLVERTAKIPDLIPTRGKCLQRPKAVPHSSRRGVPWPCRSGWGSGSRGSPHASVPPGPLEQLSH
jgi:hypothetical protein